MKAGRSKDKARSAASPGLQKFCDFGCAPGSAFEEYGIICI